MNIEKYTEELITLRHYFHQHPELALQEVETSAYIRKYLEKLGYEIVPIEPTGLIAELPSLRNREKLVVLRAEMDALPIQEQTNLPYASVNQGIDAIYAAAQVVNAIHALNENFGKQHPDAGKYIVGTGTIHGGEYTNIIADHVVLNGNIRAVHEETYMALEHELERNLQEIEKQTGTQIRMEFPKDPVYAFANDEKLTETAKAVGEEVFGDKFVLEEEDELFLSGDNAYRYFRETRGLFTVFLAGIPGENHPLHHSKFQLDEKILPYSVEALYKIITTL